MPRSEASRALRRRVGADLAAAVRVYVIAPAGTPAQDITFTLRAQDEKSGVGAEADTHATRFDAPGETS